MSDKLLSLESSAGSGKTVIAAEIGINHNGDLQLAIDMVRAAADSGADVVKFQNYLTEDFIASQELQYKWQSHSGKVSENQFQMFKRCELPRKSWEVLKNECDQCGVHFQSTPTNQKGLNELVDLGVTSIKNGSDYLSNLDLIRSMGETGLPLVLSIGMANLSEIDRAVRVIRETGNSDFILLHCVSLYPCPPEAVNLNRIPSLRDSIGVHVGYSDHVQGNAASVGAVVLGARWIEKHFTIDKKLEGPDQKMSADPGEFSSLVREVRDVETALGESHIYITDYEQSSRKDFKLSCAYARDYGPG